MSRKVNILNLEWITVTPSRDRVIASLVCNYLRYLGYSVFEGSVFNGYELIFKLKPDVLFISNSVGASINSELIEYASKLGIPCFSGFSEGNFRENYIHDFIWGHNKKKTFYEKKIFIWSQKKKELTLKYYPELNSQIKICGGIGFDLYQVRKNHFNKSKFLEKHNKNEFSKIIGVGCFDFGPFYEADSRYTNVKTKTSFSDILIFQKDRKKFHDCLEELIIANLDRLFLLKEHPSNELGQWASGIEDLEKYKNVITLKNEATIFDCISISDIWITYESTTALEAWLLNKQTCLLNPSGGSFNRDEISNGSPLYKTTNEVQLAIDLSCTGKTIQGYNEKSHLRSELIENTIQWNDGLNHVRTGNVLAEAIKMKNNSWGFKKIIFSVIQFQVIKQLLFWKIAIVISKYFKYFLKNPRIKSAIDMRFYEPIEIEKYSKDLMINQQLFYEKLGLTKEQLRLIKSI